MNSGDLTRQKRLRAPLSPPAGVYLEQHVPLGEARRGPVGPVLPVQSGKHQSAFAVLHGGCAEGDKDKQAGFILM